MPAADLPEVPPGFTPVLIFDDPTPNTIVINRIARRMLVLATHCTDLGKPENSQDLNDYLDMVILIGRKVISVWKHLQAYQQHEKRLVEKFSVPGIDQEFSQDLFEEFDVFAVQIKSTLDHLVKTLRPVIGRKWTMYTFGEKGETVFNSLKRNTSRKYAGQVRIMEHLLYSDLHKGWVGAIIDSRDRMNHGIAGGMDIKNFAVFRAGRNRWAAAMVRCSEPRRCDEWCLEPLFSLRRGLARVRAIFSRPRSICFRSPGAADHIGCFLLERDGSEEV